jgi:putative membrane protein
MLTDFILASLHHVAVFALMGLIVAELVIVSPDMTARALKRVAAVDLYFGIVAAAVVVFGVLRVIYGAKGYEYYIGNHVFWLKMLLFVIIGLLSVAPTMRYLAWGRSLRANASFRPEIADIRRVKLFIHIEATLFLLIPIAAAAMARGYGAG